MFLYGNRSLDLTLGYRLTEHGGSIAEFYERVTQCGDRGSMIVVQSELGQVFGAYTKVKWAVPETDDFGHQDEDAFLF